MDTINLAVIGTRGHWPTVARELEQMPEVRVVALADGGDTIAPAAAWCKEHDHTPSVHADHREMLNHVKPDAVVVAGPFERHAEMCIDAIDRRVHVLTEKPAALTIEHLDKLRDAHSRNPDVHLAGMMFSRYEPGFWTAKRLIRDGAIGEVRLINARKSYKLGKRPDYYRDRATYGGTIPWIGSHAIDWILWFAGGEFKTVCAWHSAAHNHDLGTMELDAACQFALAGDRCATVSVDYRRPANAPTHGDDWARVVGTDGVMEVRTDSVRLINRENDGSKAVPAASETILLHEFVDHIRGKAKSSLDAKATLDLTEACLLARQSADEKRVIEFPTTASGPHRG